MASDGAQQGPPLIARVLLDAIDVFDATAENVPPPGRGGPIGRLSRAGWTIGHNAEQLDEWVNEWCGGFDQDPWASGWHVAGLSSGATVHFDEALEAWRRVASSARGALEDFERGRLTEPLPLPPGRGSGGSLAYILARSVAHLFSHAGELTVVNSLLRRSGLEMPGPLERSFHAPIEAPTESEDGGVLPLVLRLLLDAREAFSDVADMVPAPAAAGAFERLNSGGWIVSHIAEQDDQYWNVHLQGLEADPWLARAAVRFGDAASKPSYAEARAALERTFARATPAIEALTPRDLGRIVRRSRIPERGDQTVQDLAVLQLTHVYALAGELAAIASLAGAPDPGLPRKLRHTLEARA